MSYKIDSSIRARYYSSTNRGSIKYIVMHYTGNSGTSATARGNANYFHTCTRKASAHYVVDEYATIYQCVPDNRAAWSVGDSRNGHGRYYGKCTNSNSISVEMVSHSNGRYYIPAATIQRAAELVRDLMRKYNINADHVIRHYDVTTKACPEPMCGTREKDKKWAAFKAMLVATQKVPEGKDVEDMTEKQVRALIDKVAAEKAQKAVSTWAKQAWDAAVQAGILDGTNPHGEATREQITQMFMNAGILPNEKPADTWAKQAWDAAVKAGILDGTNPRGLVTREQLAQTFVNVGLIGTGRTGAFRESHKDDK